MDRRMFLKLTGFAAAASALDASPIAAQTLTGAAVQSDDGLLPAGLYQLSGRVRLESPVIEITGITNTQQISWSGVGTRSASFSSYEEFSAPWRMPEVKVAGGRLESLAVVPINFV
jgi:hypothetical protein